MRRILRLNDVPVPLRTAAAGTPTGRGSARSAVGGAYSRAVHGFERHGWLFDALFKAGPLIIISVLIYPISQTEGGFFAGQGSVPWPFRFSLELLAILPLAFSRIRPGLAAGIIAFSCLCQLVSGVGPGNSAFSAPLVVYACAKYGSRQTSLGYLWVALAGSGLLGLFVFITPYLRFPESAPDLSQSLFMMLLFGGFATAVVLAGWLFGDMAGRRRRELAAITERNELLERERDHEARLAVDAERMRIAREMHDVVSHSMSVMIAQSDGGRYVVSQNPEQAGQAFETIGETGREALTELRRMLGVLREEDDARRRPAPGLRDLPQLFADVRASGLAVQARVVTSMVQSARREAAESVPAISPPADGSAEGRTSAEVSVADNAEHFAAAVRSLPALPEGVGLAAYRIVQEALTNTMKHAGQDARAEVRIGVVKDEVAQGTADGSQRVLAVKVRDTGLGSRAAGDGAGSGLLGMQERARLYGGAVETRAHEGGFQVLVRFPLEPGVVLEPQTPGTSRGARAVDAEAVDAGTAPAGGPASSQGGSPDRRLGPGCGIGSG